MPNERYIPILKLPSFLRKILGAPMGKLLVSDKEFVRNIKVDIAIGDVVSETTKHNLCVIDGKTRRSISLEKEYRVKESLKALNPPGTLSLNTRTIAKCKRIKTLYIIGEEDLAPLAFSLEYTNKTISYGQPRVGLVILTSNKINAIKVLKTFKPDIIVYNIA
ncbi:MAG: DUF359 domain-containing protein [Staphylothermus sp.]|nr:DUF359 domain-containing protein [Staphylothermus sp.]